MKEFFIRLRLAWKVITGKNVFVLAKCGNKAKGIETFDEENVRLLTLATVDFLNRSCQNSFGKTLPEYMEAMCDEAEKKIQETMDNMKEAIDELDKTLAEKEEVVKQIIKDKPKKQRGTGRKKKADGEESKEEPKQ